MVDIRRAAALVLVASVASVALALSPEPTSESVANAAGEDNAPWVLPTRPARCSTAQLAAGTVAECLVSGSDAPNEHGWPTPPFPSNPVPVPGTIPAGPTTNSTTGTSPTSTSPTGTSPTGDSPDPAGTEIGVVPLDGWTFNGYAYNGSPTLATWEAQFVGNQSTIGRVRANQLRTLPEVLPLFEGFVRDITAGGYRVNDIAAYSFRCTSGTGKTCVGRTRSALSNHTWGLAIDMNSATNPERTYTGVEGASACATPMVTDIPRWVVQMAEKWGIYWGGYGWSSGCSTPTEVRASATRDATHFEFRGTPAQARAIAVANLGGGCSSAVDNSGTNLPTCLTAGGTPAAGWRVAIDTKAPKGATAALVNIAMTGATADGYVTADACGAVAPGPRPTANGNTMKGQTIANLAVVPLDANGRFCLYRSQPMHTVVDVQGFFAPATDAGAAGALFSLVPPQRLIDTRASSFCDVNGTCTERGPVPSTAELTINAPSVPSNAVAVLANLAITEPLGPGYLTADSCVSLVPGPQTHANANFAAADTVSNLSVVPVAPPPGAAAATSTGAQFCTYATAATQSVVDLQGYFAPASALGTAPGTAPGLGFTVVPMQRLVDTRSCWSDPVTSTQRCGLPNDAGAIIRMKAPVGASAVLINLSLTDAKADGFATAQPCSLVQGPAGQSNGNVAKGRTVSNLAVVGVDTDGTFCVRVSQAMHVIVDLQGTFSLDGPLRFVLLAPVRRSDTRSTGG